MPIRCQSNTISQGMKSPGTARAARSQKKEPFRSSVPVVISLSKKRARNAPVSARNPSNRSPRIRITVLEANGFEQLTGHCVHVVSDGKLREDVLERRQVHQLTEVRRRIVCD